MSARSAPLRILLALTAIGAMYLGLEQTRSKPRVASREPAQRADSTVNSAHPRPPAGLGALFSSATAFTGTPAPTIRSEAGEDWRTGERFSLGPISVMILPKPFPKEIEMQILAEYGLEQAMFLASEFGFNPAQQIEIQRAERESFQEYDSILESTDEQVRSRFGGRAQVILGDALAELRESSTKTYAKLLDQKLGEGGRDRLESFRSHFEQQVSERFGIGWSALR